MTAVFSLNMIGKGTKAENASKKDVMMVDWLNLAANALWILGCGIALATLSYSSWKASIRREKLKVALQQSAIKQMLNLAGVLFSAGLAWTSEPWYEIGLWALLGLLFLWDLGMGLRKKYP